MYRVATERDANEMQKCNQVCLPENYPIHLWCAALKRNPNISFVAMHNATKIKGYIFIVAKDSETMVLFSLGVYHRFRNKGLATELVARAIQAVKTHYPNHNAMILQVRVSNPAVKIYRKYGFTVKEILPKYYADGEDALEMILDLKSEKPDRDVKIDDSNR